MERKFVSRLNQLRPAAEARKQASSQLKENIKMTKLKQVDPVDYDLYVQQNYDLLRKDACSKQLILLPSDDIIVDCVPAQAANTASHENKKMDPFLKNNLFVSDCLETYANKKHLVKYKNHNYGGGYRQLPSYQESNQTFLNNIDDLEKGLGNKNLLMPEFCYEIDADQKSEKFHLSASSLCKYSGKFEHQGWLNYRISSSSEKTFKRRYFHLRTSNSPIQSRSNSIDSRSRTVPANVHIMECFKEVPGQKKAENPKHQIVLDSRIACVQKTPAKFGPYSFELVESGDMQLHHMFVADGQKQFDEWFSRLEKILKKKPHNGLLPTICSSPNSTNNTFDSGNSSVKNDIYQSKMDDLGASLNESADSNDIRMLTNGNNEHIVTIKESNQEFINSFDLNKYLSEKDEELQIRSEQINLFNLYDLNDKFVDEETELECVWPEKSTSKRVLLSCENFQLNLRLPYIDGSSTKLNIDNDNKLTSNMNPELFYISLALYDTKNQQKISSNFDWIPNYEQFAYQIISESKSTVSFLNQSKPYSSASSNSCEKNIFSLNGIDFSENPSQLLNEELKQSLFNRISKALFTISDAHEDIYLVGRVEKILDGNSLHNSIQPYLIQMNESSRIKAAIKLNKKIKQLMKTRLKSYRQAFAWFAKPIYKRLSTSKTFDYVLDNESKFLVYEQDENHLSDDDLFKYLNDLKNKDRYLNKMASLCADISIYLHEFDKKVFENPNKIPTIINSCLQFDSAKLNLSKVNDLILQVDHFDLVPNLNLANLSQIEDSDSNSNEIKKAKLLRINTEFKSFLYLYPISLRYDTQKVYSRARNILVKIEFRDSDHECLSTQALNCIFKTNSNLNNLNCESNSCLISCYKTIVTHHNKTPQFYDEIKILLPLNLHDKHHILFKFYHVSCNNAKTMHEEYETSLSESITNISGKNVENLIGFSWLPVFKNGKLLNGEKCLPIAQNLLNDYLSFEQIGLGQSVGPSDIKWIDNMKLLFKINLLANSTVHTIDPHVANFYLQYEKLTQSVSKPSEIEPVQKAMVQRSMSKRKAPLAPLNLNSLNMERMESRSEVSNEISINSVKALHATEISTIVKFLPTLFNRILSTFVTTVSSNVAIHAFKSLLHFVWQLTLIGKIDNLKSFIKYMFYVDYTSYFGDKNHDQLPTLHHELIVNLVDYLKDATNNQPNQSQTHRFLTNSWFFMEIVLKSLALYTVQYKKHSQQFPKFSQEFYKSVKDFFDLLIDMLVKHASVSNSKEKEFLISAVRKCNRSIAMFIKKSLNLLNKKLIFLIVNRYLDATNTSDKTINEIKLDFIRIVCNHEHYVAFSLPMLKAVSNIHDFAEIKYEFILSDQFRQFHYLVGVLLSQFCLSLNENKEQRKASIQVLRSLICKHSFDSRYNTDKQKQARIASLYLPLVDILMENITRLSGHSVNSTKHSPSVNYSMVNTSTDSCSKMSSCTLVNPYQGVASSASMSNGSVYHSYDQSSTKTSYDPLSVIAGLAKADFDPISNGFSDTDSLSSSDDFKHLNSDKRSSFSFTVSTNPSDITALNNNSSNCTSINPSHLEQQSITKSYLITRKDKFDSSEIKDLLICLIFVLKNLNQDALLGLWYNYDDSEFCNFLTLLDLCLTTFKYRGRSNIHKLNAISRGQDIKAMIKSPRNDLSNRVSNIELLDRISSSAVMFTNRSASMNRNAPFTQSAVINSAAQTKPVGEMDLKKINRSILIESNLCHQVSATVLNILSMVLIHQKDKLLENSGDNPICKKTLDMFFYMLQSNQSELVKLRVFVALRHMITKLPSIFFDGQSSQCFSICMETLKCFNSKFESIRLEACVLIYLLLRKNYEHTRLKSISRVHSQTIISVSQLIGKMKLSGNFEILECLSIINQLAFNDQTLLSSRFSLEVDDLTKRIRNIFLATAQMKSFQNDTEMLIDSQYCLAKSYANCLELRRTWLESMASIHIQDKNYSEAAHCYLHIAAFIAENLKHQGMYTLGCQVFKKITPNIELEEEINKNNDMIKNGDNYQLTDLNQVQYTQSQLLDYLYKSTGMLKYAERYDFMPDIFKLVVAIYESNRDYEQLQQTHLNIQKAYSYLAERDQRSKEKPLATFYRVSFFGKAFEQENNKVYIYKEPGNTKLFEICDRLRKVYSKRFGQNESVEILSDSRKPNELNLDTENKNYIQVTYVQPYFEESDTLDNRITYFERNNNLKKFYYEVPYQMKDKDSNSESIDLQPQQHSELLTLCKRKIILETSNWFPYVKKRILVVYEKPIELNPLETAIDEIRLKIEDFESILKKKDITLLELYLQGGIMPQVHKGPLAYAEAFLDPNEYNAKYSKELKKKFKLTFKRLVDSYKKGIDLYFQLSKKVTQSVTEAQLNSKNSAISISNQTNKYLDMYRLLTEKFAELENNFRNLLLIDGDFELYQLQLNNSQMARLIMDTTTVSSSQA